MRCSPSHHLTWLCVRCGSTHILQKLHGTVLFMGSVQERILFTNHFWVPLQTVSCLDCYAITSHYCILMAACGCPVNDNATSPLDQLSQI